MKEVEFTINTETGEMTMELNGFIGRSCENIIEEITKVIGKPDDVKNKPEYYANVTVNKTGQVKPRR